MPTAPYAQKLTEIVDELDKRAKCPKELEIWGKDFAFELLQDKQYYLRNAENFADILETMAHYNEGMITLIECSDRIALLVLRQTPKDKKAA